jgi:hypothetical protein
MVCVNGEEPESVPYMITTDISSRSFQVADGVSLERKLTNDIESIQGVTNVQVKRVGGALEVNVVLDKLEFSVFEKVIQKELDLFDKFPEMQVRFNVVPREEETAILHAA